MIQYRMSTVEATHSDKAGRNASNREEQALCQRAMDSGKYDSMSDGEWVALCEQAAAKAREIPMPDPGKAHAAQRGPSMANTSKKATQGGDG